MKKILFCLSLILLLSGRTFAKSVTMEINDTPVSVVLEKILRDEGVGFAISADVNGTIGRLSIKDVSFLQAFKMIIKTSNQKLVYSISDDFYTVSVKTEVPVTAVAVVTTAPESNDNLDILSTDIIIDKIPLQNLSPTELLGVLSGNSSTQSNFGMQNNSFGSFGGNNGGGGFGSQNYGGLGGQTYGGGYGGQSYGQSGGYGGQTYSNNNLRIMF